MTKVFSLILVVLLSSDAYSQYSAMTYNIRYATERDGINSWDNRKEWVADLVNYYSPNVLGIQEGLFRQVSFLDSALVGYDFIGVGRDDAEKEGEFSAIFYQSDKLDLITSQTFWLSLTSEEPSYGWGANYRRVCTWAEFEVKETKKRFFVFNTHFDHESEEARIESAKLIHVKVRELNTENLPVVIMGDLNAIPDSEPIEFLTEFYNDSREISNRVPFGPVGTYNGFDTSHPLDVRIDYVFVSKDIQVDNYAVFSHSRENRTPSDHLPVFINFQF